MDLLNKTIQDQEVDLEKEQDAYEVNERILKQRREEFETNQC